MGRFSFLKADRHDYGRAGETPLPVYGDGMQVRDWLYVETTAAASGGQRKGRDRKFITSAGTVRCQSGVVGRCCRYREDGSLVRYVPDRRGMTAGMRCPTKTMRETGWEPVIDFETGLPRTIEWYRGNSPWLGRVRSGEYRTYYERNYGNRKAPGHRSKKIPL
jgi:dTDP-glucose 4,6-dehydratase